MLGDDALDGARHLIGAAAGTRRHDEFNRTGRLPCRHRRYGHKGGREAERCLPNKGYGSNWVAHCVLQARPPTLNVLVVVLLFLVVALSCIEQTTEGRNEVP